MNRHIWIVCTRNAITSFDFLHEAWESHDLAICRTKLLAERDAEKTKLSVPSGQVRIETPRLGLFLVQKFTNDDVGAKWVTLRAYEAHPLELKDNVIERLAEVADEG